MNTTFEYLLDVELYDINSELGSIAQVLVQRTDIDNSIAWDKWAVRRRLDLLQHRAKLLKFQASCQKSVTK